MGRWCFWPMNLRAILIQNEPAEIIELFKLINGSWTTVVVATHDPHVLKYVNRRVITLVQGCWLAERRVGEGVGGMRRLFILFAKRGDMRGPIGRRRSSRFSPLHLPWPVSVSFCCSYVESSERSGGRSRKMSRLWSIWRIDLPSEQVRELERTLKTDRMVDGVLFISKRTGVGRISSSIS